MWWQGEEVGRIIRIRPEPDVPPPVFKNNRIRTAKYNAVTFLPVFLFDMFSRVAYLYFLAQVGVLA